MKLDEDYEDVEHNTYSGSGNSRLMSWLVLAVAVGGFAALAYYAYQSGSRATTEGDLVTIEAEVGPVKEAPIDPEGEQFANKDKTIYNVIDQTGGPAMTEKLMPEPERPVAAADVEDEDSIAAAMEPAAAPVPAAKAPASEKAEPVEVAAAAKETAPAKPIPAVESTTTYVAEQVKAAPSFEAPTMINEKTVTVRAEKPMTKKPAAKSTEKRVPVAEIAESLEPAAAPEREAPAPAAPAAVVAAAPATPSARSGAYKVQLGAFKSEAEAMAAWKKISSKHAAVVGSTPSVMKADLPKGTFYRLRAGSFADSAAAKAACVQLAGQPCMPVK